jgi:hypothetical protein
MKSTPVSIAKERAKIDHQHAKLLRHNRPRKENTSELFAAGQSHWRRRLQTEFLKLRSINMKNNLKKTKHNEKAGSRRHRLAAWGRLLPSLRNELSEGERQIVLTRKNEPEKRIVLTRDGEILGEAGECLDDVPLEPCALCELSLANLEVCDSCDLSTELARIRSDELMGELRLLTRLFKKYGEPETVAELMDSTECVGEHRVIGDMYCQQFGGMADYVENGCPHCNAEKLKTTVRELTECIEGDIVLYFNKADEAVGEEGQG